MTRTTRRHFLACWAGIPAIAIGVPRVAGAFQGLGQFAAGAGPAPCKLAEKATPAVPPDPAFRPGSPARTSLNEPAIPGTRLVLTGTVSGLTCGPIKGAIVDFWQADSRGVYDKAGFRLRGHQSTDPAGHYRLETIVPAAADTRAPHLNVRVKPPGRAAFATRLFFPNHARNTADAAFRSELVLHVTDGPDPTLATFDIVLNL